MCWILMLLDVALGVRGHEVDTPLLFDNIGSLQGSLLLFFAPHRPSLQDYSRGTTIRRHAWRVPCSNPIMGFF